MSAASSPSQSPTQPIQGAAGRGRAQTLLLSPTTQSTAKHKRNTTKESTAAARRNSGSQAKGQGKITDFISPSRQVANKNNRQNAKSQAANRDSESAQESVVEKPRGRGRPKATVSSPLTSPTIGASIANYARKKRGRSPDPSSSEPDEDEEEEEEVEEEESPPPSPTPPKKGRGRGAAKKYVLGIEFLSF